MKSSSFCYLCIFRTTYKESTLGTRRHFLLALCLTVCDTTRNEQARLTRGFLLRITNIRRTNDKYKDWIKKPSGFQDARKEELICLECYRAINFLVCSVAVESFR